MLTPEMQKAVKEIVKDIIANPEAAAAPAPTAEELEKAKKDKEEKDEKESKKKDSKKDEDKDDKDDKKDMKKSEGASNESKTETSAAEVKAEGNEVGQLSAEEVELVKAWRASQSAEAEITKAVVEAPKQDEELKKALETQKSENEALKKSIDAQSDLIKSLTEKVEKMANQPAYDKKAVTTLEPIEKSQPETEKATKRQVLNALLELQQEGEATSHDVSKYEATNQLSKSLQEKVKTKIVKGK